jgi:LPXTG-motif cell wall-anchored protein
MFTNSREAAKPDTGINLDFIPYMLVLVLAAAGGAVLAYKKRRMVR